tara:strand:+ start:201 stop:542 length:342 start_codon:yes stop_codon:yes gene_type:complete
MKNISIIIVLSILVVAGCTSSGEIYDETKHEKEDFSLLNTIGAIGAAAVVINEVYNSSGNSSGYSSFASSDSDWDWDYQPANNQWVCRGIQTGQYAELENCAYDEVDDDRWPG